MRGDAVGSLHRGTLAVAHIDGEIALSLGDPLQPVYLRSAAKPFQAMPAVLGSDSSLLVSLVRSPILNRTIPS